MGEKSAGTYFLLFVPADMTLRFIMTSLGSNWKGEHPSLIHIIMFLLSEEIPHKMVFLDWAQPYRLFMAEENAECCQVDLWFLSICFILPREQKDEEPFFVLFYP